MPDGEQIKDFPTKSPDAAREAREQATEYESVFASHTMALPGGDSIEIPPHPNYRLLDDDKLQAWDELLFEVKSYDREPDVVIPEQEVKDKHGNIITTLPSQTRKGAIIVPHQKGDELIKPSWEIRVVRTALGDEDYGKLRKANKSAADVWRIWNRQTIQAEERRAADSKSAGSTVDGEAVPKADSA